MLLTYSEKDLVPPVKNEVKIVLDVILWAAKKKKKFWGNNNILGEDQFKVLPMLVGRTFLKRCQATDSVVFWSSVNLLYHHTIIPVLVGSFVIYGRMLFFHFTVWWIKELDLLIKSDGGFRIRHVSLSWWIFLCLIFFAFCPPAHSFAQQPFRCPP